MVETRGSHLKKLHRELPDELLVDSAWLKKKGVASNLRAYYVKAGWLDQPARGVFRRPQGRLGWKQVVISLQTLLDRILVVGGYTALDMQGLSHYLAREVHTVFLYGPDKPPSWLDRLELPQRFVYRNSKRLFRNEWQEHRPSNLADAIQCEDSSDFYPLLDSLTTSPWGEWRWPPILSRPERAYLEFLDELPGKQCFDHADKLMENGAFFCPRLLQKLLENCNSVKVKRLFFFFADRNGHSWLKYLNKEKINFGRGKRMLVNDGRLDPDYLITVPTDLETDDFWY